MISEKVTGIYVLKIIIVDSNIFQKLHTCHMVIIINKIYFRLG